MYVDTCLQSKKITQVHHKVSKNGFKVGEALLHCLKRGRAWICFDCQLLYFPPNLTEISCQSSSSIASKVDFRTWICFDCQLLYFPQNLINICCSQLTVWSGTAMSWHCRLFCNRCERVATTVSLILNWETAMLSTLSCGLE